MRIYMLEFLFYFLICLIATGIGAICGNGGGVIIKPVLDAVSGLPVAQISFLSSCTVLSMSIASLLRSRKGDVKIEPKRGTFLAIGAAFGGVLGKYAFEWVKKLSGNDSLVGAVQSIILIFLTAAVFIYVLNKDKVKSYNIKSPVICAVVGLLLGIISAFLGIGGGPVNITVLFLLFSMDTKTAALNSIYIIFFSQVMSIGSSIIGGRVPEFSWSTLIVMIIGGVLGGIFGREISRKISTHTVDLTFRGLLVLIMLICGYNFVRYAGII